MAKCRAGHAAAGTAVLGDVGTLNVFYLELWLSGAGLLSGGSCLWGAWVGVKVSLQEGVEVRDSCLRPVVGASAASHGFYRCLLRSPGEGYLPPLSFLASFSPSAQDDLFNLPPIPKNIFKELFCSRT